MENISMYKVIYNLEHAINSKELNNPDLLKKFDKTRPKISKYADYLKREAIQYICHLNNKEN